MRKKHTKALLCELEKLVEASNAADFTAALDIGALSGDEREAARLFNKVLKNYQNAVEYGQMKYRLTGNALGIAHWDMELRDSDPINPDNVFSWSPEFRRMLGFSDENDFPDLLSSWSSRLHPGDKGRVLNAFAAHIADRTGKTPYNLEYRLKMKSGEYRHFRAVGTTSRDKAGKPLRVAGALEDITGRVQTLEKMRDAEERVQAMLAASPLGLTMWDKRFRLIDCSRHAVDTLEFSGKQEFMKRFLHCVPEYQPNGGRSLEMLTEAMTKAFETGSSRLEWTHLTAGGEPIVFDILCIRVKYKSDYALMLYARDIREDKKMLADLARRDEMLAAQAHWYKSLLDAIPLPLNVVDTDMNLTFANTTAEKFFGKNREELLNRPCCCWNAPICGTADCSIARAKRGLMQSYFKYNGVSCLVDTEIIRDATGEILGFLEIAHDVTEVEKTAQQQAEEANDAKNAFLATISHEMRTPLNAVIGLSELTLDSGALNEEAEANLEKIYNAGSTLLSIVNDILDLSKIKSGKFGIVPGDYDVPSMVNDAIAQNVMRIGSKPIRFVLDIDADMPARLHGDDLRVKQIITNLLSNAFKYTEKGTVELALRCEREGETVRMMIRVSDTGVGIRLEDRARLFFDYSQVDVKANRRAGGTGLGLSITKNLAGMMGGDVEVASTYGEGSVFTVTIRQGFVSDAVIGAELADHLRSFRYATNKRSRNAQLNRIKLPYARVLVVDDHEINLDVAKGLMRPYGMHIDCVTSGQEAIDAIHADEGRYNAIFMDHMMPGMDGVEATRRIRGICTYYAETIPIIALTANAVAGNEEMFIHNGFDAFISKPIDMRRLDEVIRRFVRNKAQEALLVQGEQELDMRRGRDRRKGGDRRKGNSRRAADRENTSGLLSPGKKIDGLAIAEGLNRFGDEEAYLRVLHSYALNTKSLLKTIMSIDPENLADYAITVHGMKGSSRGICAEPVGRLAEALEQAAKSGDFDFVRDNNPAFLESVGNLVDDIETMLADMAKSDGKPKKDKPDNTLLAQLQIACDTYDIDGVDTAMAAIAAFEYESEPGLVDWLRENVIRMNFEQIKERIAAMR